jgi:serine/threonine protein kinase
VDLDAPARLIGGRYRLGPVVGRGGMGIVWQARDELLGRDVAVKELTWPPHLSAAERETARRRAVREAAAAARLSHRNVIQVFDIVADDESPCIVMELLPPRSLRDYLQQQGPLGPVQAARLGLEILAALRAAHALGIVHRDVKPANILMTGNRAVLIDFGIAQAAETSVDATTMNMLVGSPAYIAPERARGEPAGPAADLWGLGASLYAAVEGSSPFERAGGSLASLLAVVTDEPEPAAHAGPLLWPVISGLLRKDPAERLDAAEAERMLRLASEPPPPAPEANRGSRWSRTRVAALAGTAALAMVAASGTAAVLVDRSGPARHQAASPAAPRVAGQQGAPAGGSRSSTPRPRRQAASTTPRMLARTSPRPHASPGPSARPAGSAGPVVMSDGDNSAPPGQTAKPAKPPKPPHGHGKGKGNGKGKHKHAK